MRSGSRWLRPAGVGAPVLLAIACAYVSLASADDAPIAVADFSLKSIAGGDVSLHESLAKGPVLITFWATWCKPCLQELPKLDAMWADWSEQGLTTFAVSIDKPRSHGRVRAYTRSAGFGFDVLLDPNQEAFRKLQGQSVPYLVLLDSSGDAAYTKVGYRPGDEKALAEAVDALLARHAEADTSVAQPREAGS